MCELHDFRYNPVSYTHLAACRLCAFGRKKDAPGAYTMALDEAFETCLLYTSRCV